jgi:non-heme chloroperoxidase
MQAAATAESADVVAGAATAQSASLPSSRARACVETDDGVRLFVREWGPVDGLPVLLVHAWALSSLTWDRQQLALGEAGFRVIASTDAGMANRTRPRPATTSTGCPTTWLM